MDFRIILSLIFHRIHRILLRPFSRCDGGTEGIRTAVQC